MLILTQFPAQGKATKNITNRYQQNSLLGVLILCPTLSVQRLWYQSIQSIDAPAKREGVDVFTDAPHGDKQWPPNH